MRIYVGNLPRDTHEDDLIEMFSEYGVVRNIKIIRDRYSNAARGYAFLELPDAKAAFRAITDWDQGSIDDQVIRVDVAKASLKEFEIYRERVRV
jgi:RNA recognition motif-containing protein